MMDQETRYASIRAINNFKGMNKLSDGKSLQVQIDVEDEKGKSICVDTCSCNFFYQSEHNQYTVNIFWQYNDEQLENLGLYTCYNTNFQEMSLEEQVLTIRTKDRVILISAYQG